MVRAGQRAASYEVERLPAAMSVPGSAMGCRTDEPMSPALGEGRRTVFLHIVESLV